MLSLPLSEDVSLSDLEQLIAFLRSQGTFHFPVLPNGLFPAAGPAAAESTNYHYVWVRDNVHIAHAHEVLGEQAVAAANARALAKYFGTQRSKMRAIIDGNASPENVMKRPHIRFRQDMAEIAEKWAHAQNDALGYFLWHFSRMASAGHFTPDADEMETLADLVRYLGAIRYWQDADSGHWEEVRKVSASSIGCVVAGLEVLAAWLESLGVQASHLPESPEKSALAALKIHPSLPVEIAELIRRGRSALARILPHECIEADPQRQRRCDGALLFLIYPMKVVDDAMADAILADVAAILAGEYGIRRYLGDSYWCADYKAALGADERTADFSDDLDRRDRLAQPGLEAQWCIFDPVMSVVYGERYQRLARSEDFRRQLHHLNRSLRHLTTPETRPQLPGYRGPESYYSERGAYVPNDILPLLWTEANLAVALETMRQSLQSRPK